jgi:hypothetical protein
MPPKGKKVARLFADDGAADGCKLCSVMPLARASNWNEHRLDEREHPVAIGPLCARCGGFVTDSPFTLDDLLEKKKTKQDHIYIYI